MSLARKVPEVFPCTTTMRCELDDTKTKKDGAGKKSGGSATIKNAALRRWEDAHRIRIMSRVKHVYYVEYGSDVCGANIANQVGQGTE